MVEVDGGPGVPPHARQIEAETFFVLEGQATFTRGEGTVTATPGRQRSRIAWQPSQLPAVGGSARRLMLVVGPAGLTSLFEALAAPPAGPPDPQQVGAIAARHDITPL